MQTSLAVEQIKTLNGPRVHAISPVGKEKVYGGKQVVTGNNNSSTEYKYYIISGSQTV